MVKDEILSIINLYSANSYYKYGNIPGLKLQNAMQCYPVDPNETPLALIDTTVFGSAKTGMVIGLKGIYFKNDWTTKTDKNFISWDELSESKSTISNGASYCVMLIPGCEINLSGSSMSKEHLINLLTQLVNLYRTLKISPIYDESVVNPKTNVYNSDEQLLLDKSPTISEDIYQSLVPELLGLCIAADGHVEDEEIDLATAIIDHDEDIIDKHKALIILSETIEKFINDRNKSSAIFKLKAASLTAKTAQITNDLKKEKLIIMLDGLLDANQDQSRKNETQIIINSIKSKLM